MKLRQLVERADDTEMALGSDIIGVALEGYALLKVSGKGEALKGARKELSARFAKGARAARADARRPRGTKAARRGRWRRGARPASPPPAPPAAAP